MFVTWNTPGILLKPVLTLQQIVFRLFVQSFLYVMQKQGFYERKDFWQLCGCLRFYRNHATLSNFTQNQSKNPQSFLAVCCLLCCTHTSEGFPNPISTSMKHSDWSHERGHNRDGSISENVTTGFLVRRSFSSTSSLMEMIT